ncbi:TRAM domain-containing protein, partial [uncultured Bilophila sp.]
MCELSVDALVSDGRGLGRFRGVAVFVDGALPGQTVRARIAAVRK